MNTKLGFIILAHQNLDRTAQLVRFLSSCDCPVSVHVDLSTPMSEYDTLRADLDGEVNVVFARRVSCGWGQFSIVQASLNAAEVLLDSFPDVTNVFLASGSCLPAKPIKQLLAFLDRHQGIDFIESFSEKDGKWVKDGLDEERFTLYFPLSWRRHRFAFDRLVSLQRKLGINRKIPNNIVPHMGSQWWCLTAQTLRKIVNDPERAANDRFFSKSWIPDESYFQTLARNHSKNIRPESLTFATFDYQGKPFLFYDDHLQHLPKSSAFFIRKAWPGANKLYRELLKNNRKNFPISQADPHVFRNLFETANSTRTSGNIGRFLQGRFPNSNAKYSGVSAKEYCVFTGYAFLFKDFPDWAFEVKKSNVFGNLFARNRFTFRKFIALAEGNLTANIRLRNANPKSYLSNFLAGQNGENRVGFQFDVTDRQPIMPVIACDDKAHFIVIKEAWLVLLAGLDEKTKTKTDRALVFQAREEKLLKELAKNKSATFTIFSLSEALSAPGLILQKALQSLDLQSGSQPTSIPMINDISKVDSLVRKLEKNGLSLEYRAKKRTKKSAKTVQDKTVVLKKPYVVK